MRGKATWLILVAVGAVVTAGVVDAVRGSSSNPEAAQAGESVVEASTTTALTVETATEPVATTEPAAIADPVDATVTAIASAARERLPSCDTEQLRLTFTVSEGLAAVVLRRVKGQPCHHGGALHRVHSSRSVR